MRISCAPPGSRGELRRGSEGGRHLEATLIEAPPSFSIHDETTISAVWPMMPCYSNLLLFDPLKKQESLTRSFPSWPRSGRGRRVAKSLAFSLRKDVKWHDGQPFTSKDVKYTFDTIREVEGVTAKLRVNPRKLWYDNVESIDATEPQTAIVPAQAASTVAPPDAGLGLLADLSCPRAVVGVADQVRWHRSVQAQRVSHRAN